MQDCSPPQTLALEAYQLTKHYPAQRFAALQDLSFQIPSGVIAGLLGPNGAGKTTTLKILAGLIPADSGSAYVCGHSLATQAPRAKSQVGYMPEHNPLPAELTVSEYLRYRADLKGIAKPRSAIEKVLEACDLARSAAHKRIGALSKGYCQRVGIADALLGDPPVMILDEPTIGLDPHQLQGVRTVLKSLKGACTVLISSHILAELEPLCDQLVIMHQGYGVAAGSTQALRERFFNQHRCRICIHHAPPHWPQELAQGLGGLGLQPVGDQELHVTLGPGVTPEHLARRVCELLCQHPDWVLGHFSSLEPSLEAIFMAATRKPDQDLLQVPGSLQGHGPALQPPAPPIEPANCAPSGV